MRLPFVIEDRDRYGNVRRYVRRKGRKKVRLLEAPGSAAFAEEYKAALEAIEQQKPARKRDEAGTLGWLARRYIASAEFRGLHASTQRARSNIIVAILREPGAKGSTFEDCPIDQIKPQLVRVLRDRKAETPAAANDRLKALRGMFKWAIAARHMQSNPARDVEKLKGKNPNGHRTWGEEQIAAFEKRHPVGTKARLALGLLLWTGVRRSDVVKLGRQHIRNGAFEFTATKGAARKPVRLTLPILPCLQELIDASPTGPMVFLQTEYGRPFAVAGFGNWFRDRCNEAGLKGFSAHGLRKAGATTAAENGATAHQLMSIFGWSNIAEAERYTRAADQKRLARQAMGLLSRGVSHSEALQVSNRVK